MGNSTTTLPPGIVAEGVSLKNPITYFKERTGEYPSNAQTWWSMKRPPEVGTEHPPKQYLEVFDPFIRHQAQVGNTASAKGHYIVKAFHKDREEASGVNGVPLETSSGARPKAVGFYAGRVFYSGVFSPGFSTEIYFSQIIERPSQVAACYQIQDPTAEDLRDLLPSDGGVLTIPEVGEILHLTPIGRDLYVFASNGPWSIGGGDKVSFAANDFSITKVAGTPSLSSLSFVDVEGYPLWWNNTSINTISPNESGQLAVSSLTDTSLKTFYNQIPAQSKIHAKGAYNALQQTVHFLYRSTFTEDKDELYSYDRVLVLDTVTGAWSPWSLPDSSAKISGIFTLQGSSSEESDSKVFSGVEQVLVGSEEVVVSSFSKSPVDARFKYLVRVTETPSDPPPPDPLDPPLLKTGLTFGEESRTDYTDWVRALSVGTGVDYVSSFSAGYGVYGEGNRKFQSNYITVNYKDVEQGGAYLQGVWDYSTHSDNSRWSSKQSVYHQPSNHKHGHRKLKVRGHGKSLQVRVSNKGNTPFEINGWSILVTSNTDV